MKGIFFKIRIVLRIIQSLLLRCGEYTTFLQEGEENVDYQTGIFVDIFPLDRYPEGKMRQLKYRISDEISLAYEGICSAKGQHSRQSVLSDHADVYEGKRRGEEKKNTVKPY